MSTVELNYPNYRYFVTDLLTGTLLAEIPFYGVTWERAVKGAGGFSGLVPFIPSTDHLDLYNSTMPGKVALYVVRDGTCVWGGVIWSRDYDVVSNILTVTGSEFTSYLYRRVIWKTIQNTLSARIDPVGSPASSVDIEIVGGSFDFVAGETVYIGYTSSDMYDYSGYYTVQASPAPTSTTARATKPTSVSTISVSTASIIRARADSGVVTLTFSGSTQPFESGEGVRVTGVGSTYNGAYKITGVSEATSEEITHFSRAGNVATLYCRYGCDFEPGSIVTITGVTGYNGTNITVLSVSGNTFTYANTGSNTAKTALGTTGSAVARPTITYEKRGVGTVAQSTETGTATLHFTNANIRVRTDTTRFIRDILGLVDTDFSTLSFANTEIEPGVERSLSVSSLSRASNVTTVTTDSAHKLVVGQRVDIRNANQGFNGRRAIASAPTSTTFTYSNVGSNTSELSATTVRDIVAREFFMVEERSNGVTRQVPYARLTTGDRATGNSSAHGFLVGQTVTVADVDAKGWEHRIFNTRTSPTKRATITEVTADTFTYQLTTRKKQVPNAEAAVARKKRYDNVATITTARSHSFKVGDTVRISNVNGGFNGTKAVTAVPSATAFRYVDNGEDVATTTASGKVTLVKKVISRGTATRTVDVRADTYGPFPQQSDINMNVSPETGFSGINKQPVDVIRGYELSTVGELLDKYVTDLEAFDYRIDCAYDASSRTFSRTLVLTPVNFPDPPAPGQASPLSRYGADGLVFEYPGNIESFTVNETAETAATRVFMAGDNANIGDGGSQPYSATADYELLNKGWPILDNVQKSYSGAKDESTLFSEAKKVLKQLRAPVGSFNVTVSGSVPPVVGTYKPGDWCSIVTDDEFVLKRLASDLEPRSNVIVRKIDAYSVSVPDGAGVYERIQLRLIPEWEVDALGE
jgi:hypothetical protein